MPQWGKELDEIILARNWPKTCRSRDTSRVGRYGTEMRRNASVVKRIGWELEKGGLATHVGARKKKKTSDEQTCQGMSCLAVLRPSGGAC